MARHSKAHKKRTSKARNAYDAKYGLDYIS